MKLTESTLRSIIREELRTYMPPRETLGYQNVARHELYDFIESLEEKGLERREIVKTAAKTVYDGLPKEYYQEVVSQLQNSSK